jgi:uncharacterized protein YkwD
MRRVILIALVVASTLATDAGASRPPERRVASKVNVARVNHELRRLDFRPRLTRYAERHARKMCNQRRLFHGTYGWPSHTAWGQVVGYGPSTRAVFRRFMRSAKHRAIVLGHVYSRMGVGVAKAGGIMWVVVDFSD